MSPADPTAITAPLTNRIGPNPGVGQLPLPVGVIMAVVAFDLGHSRLHRWHHSTVYDEGDSNYGAVTSGWDRVFGTWFRPTQRRGRDEPGVVRMPNFPERLWELKRVPLVWGLIRQRNAATSEPTTAAMADTRHSGASSILNPES